MIARRPGPSNIGLSPVVGCGILWGLSTQNPSPIVIQPDNSLTDKRYIGRICEHHPDLNGLRLKKNHTCMQCYRDRKADYRNQPRVQAKRAAIRSAGREQARLDGLNAERLTTAIRLKAIELAKASGVEPTSYREFWDKARYELAASPP